MPAYADTLQVLTHSLWRSQHEEQCYLMQLLECCCGPPCPPPPGKNSGTHTHLPLLLAHIAYQ